MKKYIRLAITHFLLCGIVSTTFAQSLQDAGETATLSNSVLKVIVNKKNGKINYHFSNGTSFENSYAYIEDINYGYLASFSFGAHNITTDEIQDPLGGKGTCINITHEDAKVSFRFIQHITVYEKQPYVLISAEAETKDPSSFLPATRNISPFSLTTTQGGQMKMPGTEPRFTDFPFDNDDWVDVVTRNWQEKEKITGISHELAAMFDKKTMAGFVAGSLTHDCWKTGIRYTAGKAAGSLDTLVVYGGAARSDNASLPASYGGLDGTHDVMPHGIVSGESVQSPLIFLSASNDVRECYTQYGQSNATIAGRQKWKDSAPVYWNSFGVEGVLGYEKVMMPTGVLKISDFIQSMNNFNGCSPVLSIDSYDQNIYSTEMLKSIQKYAGKKGQKIGFYFTPFALWTWTNNANNTKLQGSDYSVGEVILKDSTGNFVPYKKGDWGAFPLDPTHPATRLSIIDRLQKAKAIGATFIKIDFLSAGALEASRYYDHSITTGMQSYNYGMKMLKHLIDSIMGPDIFITMAISPLFPHQYAHTRFVSTDVYSHLRNDQPGFPNWGSTAASMVSASNLWWIQGTLFPYTNMDVTIMKNFQKNPDLTEQEIKVRLYSLMTMGSILGDGSDFRNQLAAQRAKKFLNNPNVCKYFLQPRAFVPLNFSEGNGQDQQLHFYLPGDSVMLSAFNFDKEKPYVATFSRKEIGLKEGAYVMKDFLTDEIVGSVKNDQVNISLNVGVKDAMLVKLIRTE
ncbi:hypothetical protein QEG73_24030 [Chitinophagaceae bacterium 26-R-25]|nr:hypothetical protein [Chitinophagaceae bacterium 26-R-25]